MNKFWLMIGSAKFWLWYDITFAVGNTIAACVVRSEWLRLIDAWCAIVLVVCAMIQWHRVNSEVSNVN